MRIKSSVISSVAAVVLGIIVGLPGRASAIPMGWTCTGACGTLGADGVVTAPPMGGFYEYVSTQGGISGAGQLPGVGGTNGSLLETSVFSASGSDSLVFNFNYVTRDGAGFTDYSWAQLVPTVGAPIVLFDARTTPSGDTVPGFGLPPIAVTLVPPSTPIIPGGVSWLPLDPNNSPCFAAGCGYTGWIQASYTPVAGNYTIQFGVSNFNDEAWQSGLAISGTTIGGVPINSVPEPGTLGLLGAGLVGLAKKARSRRV